MVDHDACRENVLGARDCMAAGWVAGGFPWPRTPSWRRSETCPSPSPEREKNAAFAKVGGPF